MPDRDWRSQAACASHDPNLWFPVSPGKGNPPAWYQESIRAAVAVCQGCPVRSECLSYALEHDEREGVWGGTTASQRKRMRSGTRPMRSGPQRRPIPHGTARGYRLHLLRREPTCEACRAAETAYRRQLRAGVAS